MCPRTRPFPVNLQRPLDPTDKPAAAGLDRLVHIFRLQPLRVRYHTHPRYVVCSCIDRVSKLDVFENPGNILFEGPSRLINDDTGETVGVAVTESMDVRIMQNAPYAAH